VLNLIAIFHKLRSSVIWAVVSHSQTTLLRHQSVRNRILHFGGDFCIFGFKVSFYGLFAVICKRSITIEKFGKVNSAQSSELDAQGFRQHPRNQSVTDSDLPVEEALAPQQWEVWEMFRPVL